MELKETIAFNDYLKVDLRAGTIKDAEKVVKSDKLLKLTVSFGYDAEGNEILKQIVTNLGEFYAPEHFYSVKTIFLLNIPEAKMRGEISQGMIFATQDDSGRPVVINLPPSIADGTSVG